MNPKYRINKRELSIGRRVEMEHTDSKKVATKIALDHLKEYPNYYTEGLLPMEKRLKRISKSIKNKKTCSILRKNSPVNKIVSSVPNFEKQARDNTQIKLKGGKKIIW